MTKNNPFSMFTPKETKHKIEALGGAEVTLVELTQAQKAEVDAILYSNGFGDDGKPKLDLNDINRANTLKLSLSLLEPKMSVKELNTLSVDATGAFSEILKLTNPEVEEEGKN